ncbi:MAG: S49 family peptidase [Flammeovirgaceae bacterium]|nr:S49 family peptidase [Flammeovirgaceae bacterium]
MIGSDTFAEEIRKARLNDRVKAIVIRINSPGGSALASDAMWREENWPRRLSLLLRLCLITQLRAVIDPGHGLRYHCSAANNHNRSIGVFSVLFDLSSFLDNKLGITFEEVKTGDIGGLSVTRPLTAVEKSIWQKRTEDIYGSFTTKAAEGRGMPVEELRKVASGRVWTGAQAKERGLVDILGNFNDAVAIATAKAGVSDDYKLKYYPVQKSFIQEWLMGMEENAATSQLKNELGEYFKTYEQLKN